MIKLPFIRKSKMNAIIRKDRKKQKKISDKIHRKEKRAIERKCKRRIEYAEKKHADQLLELSVKHYKKISEKNLHIKKVDDKWHKFKHKAIEFASMTETFENLYELKTLNTSEEFKVAGKINHVMIRIKNFINDNENDIETALENKK